MRFLIVTVSSHPAPVSPGLIDAMTAWIDQHTKSKKMEQSWSFAGLSGGGGILNVQSHEELDAIMTGFPFGPWSRIEVYPLADLRPTLQQLREMAVQMGGGKG